MKIETTPQDNQQAKISVEIDKETLDKFKRLAAKKISRENKIQGFRPGKAPFAIVRQHFGDEHIEHQAIEMMLDDIYPKVLEESELEPSGPGQLEDVSTEEPITLTFLVPLMPEIELGDYQAIRKDYEPQEITDQDIEDVIENIKRSYATAEPVERAIQAKDYASIHVGGKLVKPEEGEDAQIIPEISRQISVGESYENWPYKGFSDEIIGLSVDEEKTFIHEYDEDTVVEKLRNKKVEFTVKIESVKEMISPEIDEEFLKNLGEEYESVEDLRKAITQQLEVARKQEYDQGYISEVIDKIVESSTIKYPQNVLDDEIKNVQKSIEEDLSRQNMDLDTYLKVRETSMEEFLEKEVFPVAEKRLERSLVLDEIAKKENIELKEEELQAEVTQTMMQLFNTPGFKAPKGKQQMRQLTDIISMDTASRILNDHVLERLKNIAAGIEEEVEETEAVVEETKTEAVEEIKEESVTEAETPPAEEAEEEKAEGSSTETSEVTE